MITKKLSKLIGISHVDFINFQKSGQIVAQESRLIPLLKTGDEGALTSIFLSSVKLIKEYGNSIFKDLNLPRSGKPHYYTEVSFPDLDKSSRLDGLIIFVSKGIVKDAIVFEMKNKTQGIDKTQIEKYIGLIKPLGIKRLCTISNEFVSNPKQSPIDLKIPKNFELFHLSWTYLRTQGQLLLHKKDETIEDPDQVEIMKEVLYYFENPLSGVCGYTRMKPGWKDTIDKISNRISIKPSEPSIQEAIESWYEEEKDIALLLSRKLSTNVKSTLRIKENFKSDILRLIEKQELLGSLSIKDSVSDIKIILDFEIKSVGMSVKIIPPQDKGTKAKITWIINQLSTARKKSELAFSIIEKDILIEANIKHARQHLRVPLSNLDDLIEETKDKEIQSFNILMLSKFGNSFGGNKKFIFLIEKMVTDFYSGIVQNLSNWKSSAPKISS